jgi:hypothetical protein
MNRVVDSGVMTPSSVENSSNIKLKTSAALSVKLPDSSTSGY